MEEIELEVPKFWQRKPYVLALVLRNEDFKKKGDDEKGDQGEGSCGRLCELCCGGPEEADEELALEIRQKREALMLSLEELGFRLHKMRGRDESELFILVGASQAVLEYHAQALKIKCPLKPSALVVKRAKALGTRPPAIRVPFSMGNREAFRSAKEDSFEFRSRLKAEIVQQAIEAPEFLGGAGINLQEAASSGDIYQFFILHNHSLQYLRDHWCAMQRAFGRGRLSELPYDDRNGWLNPTEQPIEKLREYFGEKIALYFVFVGFYAKWLFFPAVLGLLVQTSQFLSGMADNWAAPIYCVAMASWSSLFLEMWKRQQATCALEWDMCDFEETQRPRPQFKAAQETLDGGQKSDRMERNPITNEREKFFPESTRRKRMVISMMVALAMIGVVLVAMKLVLVLRAAAQRTLGLGWTAGVCNGALIHVLNNQFSAIAEHLTDWENHRDQTSYDDALILKTFVFQFANSYFTLWYIAFVKSSPFFREALSMDPEDAEECMLKEYCDLQGQCSEAPSCIDELRTMLASIFIVQLGIGNFNELFLPRLKIKLRSWFEKKKRKKRQARKAFHVEEDAQLDPYDGVVYEYNTLVLQYGYLTFFAVAFPLVSAFALLSNTVEIRTDASKLCKAYQRPIPEGAEDIGCWMHVLTVMSFMSVTSNCAIIFFSSQFIAEDSISPAGRVTGFIILEHVLLLFQVAVSAAVDDVPQSVKDLAQCIQFSFQTKSTGNDDAAEKLIALQRKVGTISRSIALDTEEYEGEDYGRSGANRGLGPDRVQYMTDSVLGGHFPKLQEESELRSQYLSTKDVSVSAGTAAQPIYAFVFDNEHRSKEANIRAEAAGLKRSAALRAGATVVGKVRVRKNAKRQGGKGEESADKVPDGNETASAGQVSTSESDDADSDTGEDAQDGRARSRCDPCGWVVRRMAERKAKKAEAAEEEEQKKALVVGEHRKRIIDVLEKLGLRLFRARSRDETMFCVLVAAEQALLEMYAEHLGLPMPLAFDAKAKRLLEAGQPVIMGYAPFSRAKKRRFLSAATEDMPFAFDTRTQGEIIRSIVQANVLVGGGGLNLDQEVEDGALRTYYPLHEEDDLKKLQVMWGNIYLAFKWCGSKPGDAFVGAHGYWSPADEEEANADDLIGGSNCSSTHPRSPLHQPLDEIREYFGDKIGLYFTFLGFYTRWLVLPAALGAIAGIIQLIQGTRDSWVVPAYGLFMAVWSTLFLEYWKREEAKKGLEWGLQKDGIQNPRPGFRALRDVSGHEMTEVNTVTGALERHYPRSLRAAKTLVSCGVVSVSILVVLFSMFMSMVLKGFLTDQLGIGWAGGIVNGLMIQIFNQIYGRIAAGLTEWENHKYEKDHDDALIYKTFVFQFANAYFVMYYTAFVKASPLIKDQLGLEGTVHTCGAFDAGDGSGNATVLDGSGWSESTMGLDGSGSSDFDSSVAPQSTSCIDELTSLLASVFMVQLIIGNTMEHVVPKVKHRIRGKKEIVADESDSGVQAVGTHGLVNRDLFRYEADEQRPAYGSAENFADYNELVLQYGYLTLFAVAFPLVAALALLNNLVEIRSDSGKLCASFRRPIPYSACDIGSWYPILQIMSFMAVTTNCAMVFFTSNYISDEAIGGDAGRVWGFLVAEHALLLLKVVIQAAIDDIPKEVKEQALGARYRFAKAAARGEAAEAAAKRAALRKNVQRDRRRRADGAEEFALLEEETDLWRQFRSTTVKKEGEEGEEGEEEDEEDELEQQEAAEP